MDKPTATFKDVCLSAVILALANMGDAFLYAYLPANYQHIGISTFWVGVILSVNRYTRIFLNGRVAWILSRKGIKTVIVMAALLASFTTVSYGWISAIPLWILARTLWGLSFSTLRFGNTFYAIEHPRRGLALGWSRALMELGPVLALTAGPILLQDAGRESTFLAMGFMSLAAILLVWPLRDLKTEPVSTQDLHLTFPSSFNMLVLIHAFITEGVLVVLLGRILQHEQTLHLIIPLAWVGAFLGYRRLSFVLLSPLSGWMADRWGFHKVFIYTTFSSAAGLVLMLSGATFAGMMATFTFSAMSASAATGGGIGTGNSRIKEVSDNATWRDIGMATGALAGALLLSLRDIRWLLIVLVMLYALGLLHHRAKSLRKA